MLLGAVADDLTGAADLAPVISHQGTRTVQAIGALPRDIDFGDDLCGAGEQIGDPRRLLLDGDPTPNPDRDRAGVSALQLDALEIAAGTTTARTVADWVTAADGARPALVYSSADPAVARAVQNRLRAAQPGPLVEALRASVGRFLLANGFTRFLVSSRRDLRRGRIGARRERPANRPGD